MSARTIKTLVATAAVASLAIGGCAPTPSDLNSTGTPTTTAGSDPTTSSAEPTLASPSPTSSLSESAIASPAVDVEIDPAPDGKPGAASCYNDAGTPAHETEIGPELRPGVVKAWLCGDAPGGYGTVGPLEPLVLGIDELVAAYDALPPLTDNNAQEAANYVRLVFEYPDGSQQIIGFDEQDSTAVTGGAEQKQGSLEFYSTVRGLWIDQRVALGAEAAPENIVDVVSTCPAPQAFVEPHPMDQVVGGWVCMGGSEEFVEKALDPALAKLIASALEENSTPIDADSPTEGTSVSLVTTWGESIRLAKLENRAGFLWKSDQGWMNFDPRGELDIAMGEAILAGS